jgi:hypothetical protein
VKRQPEPWRLTKPAKPKITPQRIEALAEWANVVDPNFLYLAKQLKANAGTWRNFGRVIEATEEKKGKGRPPEADDIWLLQANAVRQPGETPTESIRRMLDIIAPELNVSWKEATTARLLRKLEGQSLDTFAVRQDWVVEYHKGDDDPPMVHELIPKVDQLPPEDREKRVNFVHHFTMLPRMHKF